MGGVVLIQPGLGIGKTFIKGDAILVDHVLFVCGDIWTANIVQVSKSSRDETRYTILIGGSIKHIATVHHIFVNGVRIEVFLRIVQSNIRALSRVPEKRQFHNEVTVLTGHCIKSERLVERLAKGNKCFYIFKMKPFLFIKNYWYTNNIAGSSAILSSRETEIPSQITVVHDCKGFITRLGMLEQPENGTCRIPLNQCL